MNKSVLISGGLGFIGSFLAEEYLRRGWGVTLVDNLSANVVDPNRMSRLGCRVICMGIAEFLQNARETFDLMVHCASPVGAVEICKHHGIAAGEIVRDALFAGDVCLQKKIPLIHISTSEVYGFSGEYHETDDLRVPGDKWNARLEYAAGKMAAEMSLANMRKAGLKVIAIRPFNVAGPRQTSAKGFVLPTFVEQALKNEALTVFGDGSQVRALTDVRDVVRFVVEFGDKALASGEFAFNVGNPWNQTEILGLAARIIEMTQSKSGIEFTSGQAVHGPDYAEAEGHVKVPNINRASALGWEPLFELNELIELTVKELTANG